MTDEEPDLVAVRGCIARRIVGRERELELVLSAVAAGRDIVLEGPPGTSKTTILKAITAEWGIPLLFVEGNADLTPARLEQSGDGLQRRAFAGPVGTDQCHDLTLLDLERDPLQRVDVPVIGMNVLDLQHSD